MVSYPIAFLTLAVVLASNPETNRYDRTIQVSGEGVATVAPDMATIHTGVVTRASSATEALTSNNVTTKKILATLKKHEIATADIQTTNFVMRAIPNRDKQGRVLPGTAEYEVTNQVRVHVRKLANLGKILDAVVEAGGNRVSGIEFGVSDPTATLDQARQRAVADAKHRAAVLAKEAGLQVGHVISVHEQTADRPRPKLEPWVALAGESVVPVASGSEEYRVVVRVAFEVAP